MKQFVQVSRLPNGVVVVSERMPGAYSLSLGIWAAVGSRTESALHNGVSHFFEHMVFKGTSNRSALQIAREIEERGGSLNAYTTREHTCFYARTVREDFSLALDTVCDLLMNPLLDAAEAEKERKVIIEEIRSYEDSPEELAHDLFSEAHFVGQGLAMPITGTVRSVKQIGQAQLQAHHQEILQRTPLVLVATGNVDHELLLGKAATLLQAKLSTAEPAPPAQAGIGAQGVIRRKEVQQSNIIAGTSIPSRTGGRQRLSMSLLNLIFGDGMSSRLFQTVRETHGLAYSVYSSVDNYQGVRGFSISLGTDPKRQQKALDLIHREVRTLLRDGLRPGELERAKTSVLGGIKLGMDSPSSRMNRLARQILRSGHFSPFDALQKELKALSEAEVMAVAEELFLQGSWSAAAVIPKVGKKVDLEPMLNFR